MKELLLLLVLSTAAHPAETINPTARAFNDSIKTTREIGDLVMATNNEDDCLEVVENAAAISKKESAALEEQCMDRAY